LKPAGGARTKLEFAAWADYNTTIVHVILPPDREECMTADHFDETITALIERTPFHLFTVELNTGERIEIDHPHAMVIRDGAAVFLAPGGVPHLFDHDSVNQVIVVPANTDA
jgi:hypothetical protein